MLTTGGLEEDILICNFCLDVAKGKYFPRYLLRDGLSGETMRNSLMIHRGGCATGVKSMGFTREALKRGTGAVPRSM